MPRTTVNRTLIQRGSSGRCVSCRVVVPERTVLRDLLNTPRATGYSACHARLRFRSKRTRRGAMRVSPEIIRVGRRGAARSIPR